MIYESRRKKERSTLQC